MSNDQDDTESYDIPKTSDLTDCIDDYKNSREDYERALSGVLRPKGRRISEIANADYIDVDDTMVREIAAEFITRGVLVLESDGEKADPRLYRNYATAFLHSVWQSYVLHGVEGLEERKHRFASECASYQENTGFNNSAELKEAIVSDEVEHIEATGETGEVFWDVYHPWSDTERQLYITKTALKLSDELQSATDSIDMAVTGQFGDFSSWNAIDAKLGLKEQPDGDAKLREDGVLEYPDGSTCALDYHRQDE